MRIASEASLWSAAACRRFQSAGKHAHSQSASCGALAVLLLALCACGTPDAEIVRALAGGPGGPPDPGMEDPGPPVCTPGQGPTPVVDCKGNVCHVPAGPFCMGCYKAVDGDCNSDEYPFDEVNVPAFDIDQHEIRVDQYKGTTHCSQQAGDHQVVCITHGEASGHCTGRGNGWRLCTESEWEKAARGTDGRKYPWGNEIHGCDEAVYSGCNCSGGSCPVGSKPAGASPYGVMDMGGNVWEWVEDC